MIYTGNLRSCKKLFIDALDLRERRTNLHLELQTHISFLRYAAEIDNFKLGQPHDNLLLRSRFIVIREISSDVESYF